MKSFGLNKASRPHARCASMRASAPAIRARRPQCSAGMPTRLHRSAPSPLRAVAEDVASLPDASSLLPEQLVWPGRTHNCGRLREADAGQTVALCGWIDRNRNLGGLQFIDIRDHTGIMQVRGCTPATHPAGRAHHTCDRCVAKVPAKLCDRHAAGAVRRADWHANAERVPHGPVPCR